jgi:pimeloyl-ACP methyl ester carboxylesterase
MHSLSYKADDGVRIAYYDWNSDADLPPIVLQHGFSVGAVRNWFVNGVVEAFTSRGRRVIGIDARGHGESDKPYDPALYGGVRLARDVIGLIDLLNVESYDLIGYSMGAMIAIHTAARDVRARRLVLSGTGAYLLERTKGDSLFLSVGIADALAAEDRASIADPVGAWLRELAEGAGADLLALSALARSPLEPLPLDALSIPTLVLVGDADPFAQGADRLANAITGARLEYVPGNHVSTLHNPLYVTSALAFLSDARH